MEQARRRLSSLQLIQKISEQKLDVIAKDLAELRAEQDAIQGALAELDRKADQGVTFDTPDALPFLAGFLKEIDKRKAYLTNRLSEVESKALDVEEKLRDGFGEAKTNEIVVNLAREKIRQHDIQAEHAALDEVAKNMFLHQTRRH